MKSIFYIFPYLGPPPFEKQRFGKLYREQQMVRYTRSLGIRCEMIFLSFYQEEVRQNNEVQSWLFPVDNSCERNNISHTSKALSIKIEKERPDLIVFKGLGFRLAHWLVLNCRYKFQFAFICAGGTNDILMRHSEFILAETQAQIDNELARSISKDRISVLPKLNLPGSFLLSEVKDFDVINVGRFARHKNQKALIPLARDFRVAMIGDGEFYSHIKSMCEISKLNVFMPGNLPRNQVSSQIARSRLMVHTADYEGLPRVIMESFACGVPVVASKYAMPNAFDHGVHGLLVKPEDIIPAARELLADHARLQEMGNNAYRLAKENCTEDAVYKVTQQMYDTVFNSPFSFQHRYKDIASIRIRSIYTFIKEITMIFGHKCWMKLARILSFGR